MRNQFYSLFAKAVVLTFLVTSFNSCAIDENDQRTQSTSALSDGQVESSEVVGNSNQNNLQDDVFEKESEKVLSLLGLVSSGQAVPVHCCIFKDNALAKGMCGEVDLTVCSEP